MSNKDKSLLYLKFKPNFKYFGGFNKRSNSMYSNATNRQGSDMDMDRLELLERGLDLKDLLAWSNY